MFALKTENQESPPVGGTVRNATTHIRATVVVIATCSIFQDYREKIFPDAEVVGGAGCINAICSRPGVADYVISGYNVETFRKYHAATL